MITLGHDTLLCQVGMNPKQELVEDWELSVALWYVFRCLSDGLAAENQPPEVLLSKLPLILPGLAPVHGGLLEQMLVYCDGPIDHHQWNPVRLWDRYRIQGPQCSSHHIGYFVLDLSLLMGCLNTVITQL